MKDLGEVLRQTKEREFNFMDFAEEFRRTRECENTLRKLVSCIVKKQRLAQEEAERLALFYVMFYFHSFLRNQSGN